MTTILLSGPLIKLFGRVHYRELGSKSVAEAFKALKCTLEGFEAAIRDLERRGMHFAIFRNRKNAPEKDFSLCGTQEVRIVPVIGGSKRAGALQTIIGVILIAASASHQEIHTQPTTKQPTPQRIISCRSLLWKGANHITGYRLYESPVTPRPRRVVASSRDTSDTPVLCLPAQGLGLCQFRRALKA